MDKKRGITIIGATDIGGSLAYRVAEASNNTCGLHGVVGSQFTEQKEPELFKITRFPDMKEPWIDPNEPVFNYAKHRLTCDKNRKKRKRKRR